MDDRKTSLDDPEYAAFAWSRYWRIMRWMMLVAILCILVALGVLWWWNGIPSIHMVIATVVGIGLTVMLAAALMGLIFLSSVIGTDEQIKDTFTGENDNEDGSRLAGVWWTHYNISVCVKARTFQTTKTNISAPW